jgi:Coenzyme PQQ synthesis protein D (PqqD)
MADTPAPQDHVVATDFDGGEGVLVDLNSKRYYQLNETAMLVWRCLERGLSSAEIVGEMTARYDVSADHAAGSLSKLLHSLETHKLVGLRP